MQKPEKSDESQRLGHNLHLVVQNDSCKVDMNIWAKKRLWSLPLFSTRTCVNEAATSERTYTMA